jgi:division protein CdvB (Snf7/Vps24/ESCRT-III family)
MPAGSLRTSAPEAVKPTIQKEFQAVVLDQLTKLDEEMRDSAVPELSPELDDIFSEAPDLECEASAQRGSSPMRVKAASSTSETRAAVRPEQPRTLEKVDVACQRVVSLVQGGVACGVIDLERGSLLGLHNSG